LSVNDTSTELYAAWCGGYGEGLKTYAPAYDALKAFPLPMQSLTTEENYRLVLDWLYSGHPDVAALIIETQTGTSA